VSIYCRNRTLKPHTPLQWSRQRSHLPFTSLRSLRALVKSTRPPASSMELEPNLGAELHISAKLALATPNTALCLLLPRDHGLATGLPFPKSTELLHTDVGACAVFWSARRHSTLELTVEKRRRHTMKLRRGCSNPDSATTKRDQERKRR
jgi:hypothetical protein